MESVKLAISFITRWRKQVSVADDLSENCRLVRGIRSGFAEYISERQIRKNSRVWRVCPLQRTVWTRTFENQLRWYHGIYSSSAFFAEGVFVYFDVEYTELLMLVKTCDIC